MWKFTLEFLTYSTFVCVLYVISYSNHNSDEYHQVQHLRRFFLNTEYTSNNFAEVTFLFGVTIKTILFLLYN
jgi:hypothetical protein